MRGLRLVQAWGTAVGCSTLHMGTSAVLPVGPSVWNCVGAGKPAAVTFFFGFRLRMRLALCEISVLVKGDAAGEAG